MLENVLPVTGPILQATNQVDQVNMHAMGTHIKSGLLTGLLDLDIQVFRNLGNHLLNTGWMNPAVGNKLQQGKTRDLTTDRIKTGQDNRLRCIINNNINAGGGFNSPNVSSFPADDPPLHFFVGQRYHGDGLVGNIITGIPGHGKGKNILTLPVRLKFHLIFDETQPFSRIHPGFTFNRLHKLFFSLITPNTGNLFKFIALFLNQGIHFIFTPGYSLFPGNKFLFPGI